MDIYLKRFHVKLITDLELDPDQDIIHSRYIRHNKVTETIRFHISAPTLSFNPKWRSKWDKEYEGMKLVMDRETYLLEKVYATKEEYYEIINKRRELDRTRQQRDTSNTMMVLVKMDNGEFGTTPKIIDAEAFNGKIMKQINGLDDAYYIEIMNKANRIEESEEEEESTDSREGLKDEELFGILEQGFNTQLNEEETKNNDDEDETDEKVNEKSSRTKPKIRSKTKSKLQNPRRKEIWEDLNKIVTDQLMRENDEFPQLPNPNFTTPKRQTKTTPLPLSNKQEMEISPPRGHEDEEKDETMETESQESQARMTTRSEDQSEENITIEGTEEDGVERRDENDNSDKK